MNSFSHFFNWLLLSSNLSCHRNSPDIFGRIWSGNIDLSWSLRRSWALFLFKDATWIQLFGMVAHRTLAIVIIHLYVFDRRNFPRLLLIGCQSRNLNGLFKVFIGRLHHSNFWYQCLSHSILLLLRWLFLFIRITLLLFLCKLSQLRHMDVIAIIRAWILGCFYFQDLLDRLSLKHVLAVIILLKIFLKQVLTSFSK